MFPSSSTMRVQFLENWPLTGSGNKQELFDNGRERTILSVNGAGVGMVTEMATRKPIGLVSIVFELGTKSNHFSSVSLDSGDRKSSRDMEVVPIVLDDFVRGETEGDDMSSNSRFPVG